MTAEIKVKTGRPSKLTPQLQEKICDYIAKGNYLNTACQATGITDSTLFNWLKRAEEEAKNGGGMYFDLMVAIKKAEAQAEAALASMIKETALQKKDWLSAMTFLERRHPDRWGRRDRTRVDINETKTIQITHVEVVLNEAGRQPVIEAESRELLEGERDV